MERLEMSLMTRASEIAPNVYVGPTPDPSMLPLSGAPCGTDYDVLIEASDLAQMPDAAAIESIKETLNAKDDGSILHIEIPGSGSIMPPTWSHVEVDGLMGLCRWIWEITHESDSGKTQEPVQELAESGLVSDAKGTIVDAESGQLDDDGDTIMTTPSPSTSSTSLASAPLVTSPAPRQKPRKVLIHCPDGYTETTLVALTYFMYAHGLTVAEAWIRLHVERERNFFAYTTDVAVLTAIQPRILSESPARKTAEANGGVSAALDAARCEDPEWLGKLDGSLPSRILPYMYLGNLGHANNPSLLRELGIGRVVSVGERVSSGEALSEGPVREGPFAGIEFCMVDGVQDNGVDSLSGEFDRCLNFIGEFIRTVERGVLIGRREGEDGRRGDAGALPRRGVAQRDHLHRGGDERDGPQLPQGIVSSRP
jgi:dual specificity MAP kinase phosphatase